MEMTAPKKVLIVDDSRAILAIVRRVVEQVAGESRPLIKSVTSGKEALDAVPEFAPDLIITDWHMPGVSGIEMLQTLRQTGHATVRVGFVTAETTPERLAEARRNGACFVVTKPFLDDELVKAVRAAIGADGGLPAPAQAGPSLVQPEAVERLLRVAFKQLSFTLMACEPLIPQALSPFLLRCQYSQGQAEAPSVVGLLDYPALCMVGAGSGAASIDAAVAAIAKGRPDPEIVQRAGTFMRVAAKLVQGHSEAEPFKLLRAQVVTRAVAEVDELLRKASTRTDMRLRVQGCSDGLLSFLRMAT
jgi:CheY-like chemotaxis protein